jgi:hypothetical protein
LQKSEHQTEIERQRRYLDELPAGFTFPLFNARRALESQRRSGYRNTASAAREIVDNAFDALATQVHITFDTTGTKQIVRAVAFIDDGAGMLPDMARYALSWGGGTHHDDPGQISRFGFGLPNASINQAQRVEVYTRTEGSQPWTKAWLDIREYGAYGVQEIPKPVESDLPKFVKDYLKKIGLTIGSGTIVVWTELDRLTYKRVATLKEHLVDDFGVTYRYMLASEQRPFSVTIQGVKVSPTDPLFTMEKGRLFLSPDKDGAQVTESWNLSVEYTQDPETGEFVLTSQKDSDNKKVQGHIVLAQGTIEVKVVRLPLGFADDMGDRATEDSRKRFAIRKPRRGMSFVRSNREIEVYDAFPKDSKEEATGMGKWPLLQSYAYYWGVEVRFGPELDDVFGIANDKQRVRPVEDFWRLLNSEGVADRLRLENKWQTEQRKKSKPSVSSDGPSPAQIAANNAESLNGLNKSLPVHRHKQAEKNEHDEAKKRAKSRGTSVAEEREELKKQAIKKRYEIVLQDRGDGPFFTPDPRGEAQLVVAINTSHPFYTVLYKSLMNGSGGRKAKEAVDVLLFALARTELLEPSEDVANVLAATRKHKWSGFLETALKNLDFLIHTHEEEQHPVQEEVLSN